MDLNKPYKVTVKNESDHNRNEFFEIKCRNHACNTPLVVGTVSCARYESAVINSPTINDDPLKDRTIWITGKEGDVFSGYYAHFTWKITQDQ